MSIDKNQVKKVAKLSRISLDDRKLESLSKDLDSILKFVEQLNKLETKNTEPLTSIVDKTLESRKDKIDDGKISLPGSISFRVSFKPWTIDDCEIGFESF